MDAELVPTLAETTRKRVRAKREALIREAAKREKEETRWIVKDAIERIELYVDMLRIRDEWDYIYVPVIDFSVAAIDAAISILQQPPYAFSVSKEFDSLDRISDLCISWEA